MFFSVSGKIVCVFAGNLRHFCNFAVFLLNKVFIFILMRLQVPHKVIMTCLFPAAVGVCFCFPESRNVLPQQKIHG